MAKHQAQSKFYFLYNNDGQLDLTKPDYQDSPCAVLVIQSSQDYMVVESFSHKYSSLQYYCFLGENLRKFIGKIMWLPHATDYPNRTADEYQDNFAEDSAEE